MELFEALAKKRACREFTKEPVSREHLEKLVDAAGRATNQKLGREVAFKARPLPMPLVYDELSRK